MEERKVARSIFDVDNLNDLDFNDSQQLDTFDPVAKILVIGVGGAGGNAVNRMIQEGIENVRFAALNTDRQALSTSLAPIRMILSDDLYRGLGAGGDPERGRSCAEASVEKIKRLVAGADMVFITAGMGKGTGTGASPIVARCAKEAGALTVAIVTRPFSTEGPERNENSVKGLEALKKEVDSLIIVSNDNLLRTAQSIPVDMAFSKSDAVLARSVKTVAELILIPAMMNLDFADVQSTLKDSGIALIGFGSGKGPKKAKDAAESAVNSELLETSISGARKAICSIQCGGNVSLDEANQCVSYIKQMSGSNLDIKLGIAVNTSLDDAIVLSVIASGFPEDLDFTRAPTSEQYDEITHGIQERIKEAEEGEDLAQSILPDFLTGINGDK